jgi:hypothetical protein
VPHSGVTIALLVLWPVGFLYPSTMPFGQGVSWERLQEAAYDLLSDHPLAPWFDWLWASLGENTGTMSKAAEGFAVALGLLGPCLVAFAIARPGWRRAAIVPIAVAVGLAANTLSAALNFGPVHALGWVTSTVPIGLASARCWRWPASSSGASGGGAGAGGAVGQRRAGGAGAVRSVLRRQPAAWEQGRFIHFHGLAQWVGWLWPFAAGIALFRRLVRSDGARPD